ncbi:ras-related protein Rab-36 isoform X4 [Salmo salar]|uniref:Ras-related protein Rab-36 n=1 Tax=Salmo salar TaxID=8030 RepID=A0A1S3L9D4_SALSA|nr:ras-related protein Rab-36 isoform X4 [Salmo salar]|eukprot:XP_013987089.1 PREDICTED: ras-related protein Rab-36-like isoform X2 [Salmo salar]
MLAARDSSERFFLAATTEQLTRIRRPPHSLTIMQEMRNGMMHFPPPVSRDRVISKFPKCYTPQACLQIKEDWDTRAKAACKERADRHQGWDRLKMSKAVVVGDLNVGKTCLINRFCKDVFDRDYKATIGVDFEIERFELSGAPFSLQIWDTAGQEKFKCIASAYYRGAQVIITVFDMADIKSLEHSWQWLDEAMRENEPGSCSVFLVGTKSDLLAPEERRRTERDAIKIATKMKAEFWSVSAKTGENVQGFFFRVASLAFEDSVLKDMERGITSTRIGGGDSIKSDRANLEEPQSKAVNTNCC